MIIKESRKSTWNIKRNTYGEILVNVIQSQAEANILHKFPRSLRFGPNESLFTIFVPILLKTLPNSSFYKKLRSKAETNAFHKISM